MNPDELRQRQLIYLEDAKAIEAKAKEAEREITDAERTDMDALLDKADALNADIEKAELDEQRNLRMSVAYKQASASRRTPVIPEAPAEDDRPQGQPAMVSDSISVGKERLFDDPHGGYGEAPGGFGQFALDVKATRTDNAMPVKLGDYTRAIRSAAGDGVNTFIGHDGGYAIPTAFGALIENITIENSVVRPRAMQIPMDTQTISFPAVDDTTHAGNTLFGGVQAYWAGEESQLTSSKPKLSNVELRLHKLTTLAYSTGEMLDWSPMAIDSWLPGLLGEAIAWKEDDGFIAGAGGGGIPVGLINSPAILSISAETGQASESLVFENIINMDARLWAPPSGSSIIWVANKTIKTQLPLMNLAVGTGGSAVFLPANAAEGRPLQTLYGYPIVFTEHAKTLGTTGDLMLWNTKTYMVGTAIGKGRSERSIGLKFDFDQVAYRVIVYSGGVSRWRTTFTPQNGDSLSPIIKLNTRS